MVRGDGDDLVVLEAGLGMSGLYWGPVHELIADNARVVAYERAGYGASSPHPVPRSLDRLADDLDVVIDAFPHRRLVLVGHSWGGPIVRTAAAHRLAREQSIDGVVLVDPTDEHADLYFSRAARIMFSVQASMSVPLARVRLLTSLTRATLRGLSDELTDATLDASCSLAGARASAAELRQLEPELHRLRETPEVLGDTPIRVITGRKAGKSEAKVRTALNHAHQEAVDAHPGALLVSAEHSGHMVPLTEPGLIAAQVSAILD